jgi:hypothetical protein
MTSDEIAATARTLDGYLRRGVQLCALDDHAQFQPMSRMTLNALVSAMHDWAERVRVMEVQPVPDRWRGAQLGFRLVQGGRA